MRSSNWAPRRFIDSSLSRDADCVNRPMRTMNMGISGTTTTAMSADHASRRSMVPRAAGVTVTTRNNWGRNFTK